MLDKSSALVLVGPTGSGKTSTSFKLYNPEHYWGVINGDAFQVYRQVAVGTARPTVQEMGDVPHYLFGYIDCNPCVYSSVQHREDVQAVIERHAVPGKSALIVGGSLFYINGLFFKLHQPPELESERTQPASSVGGSWEELHEIDPNRASELHPNDLYRINRALEIYRTTGSKPSDCRPAYNPLFSQATFVFINPPKERLLELLFERTREMLWPNWIDEVERLVGTEWEPFIRGGFALGYAEVYDFLTAPHSTRSPHELEEVIVRKTWRYTRRQLRYWRSMRKRLSQVSEIALIEVSSADEALERSGEFSL